MTEYRRYQGKSYMVLSSDTAALGYEYPMLVKNKISGLLPLWITNADEHMQFWYDISGRQTLEDWVKIKKSGSGFLKKFMTALAETIEQTGEYLLCEDGISLAPDRIFVDAEEKEIVFCYTPFDKIKFTDALRSFMEYYLSHMEHGSREDIKKCYDVYEKCQQEHMAMEDLLQILFEKEEQEVELESMEVYETEEKSRTVKKENILQEMQIKPQKQKKGYDFFSQMFCEAVNSRKIIPWKKKRTQQEPYVFEPEEYQGESANPTVFLGSETNQILGELKYEGDGNVKNIKVTEPVFLIGSQREEADGVILDDTVSRIHARITKEEDGYYLEDMNSTNGTCRNGEPLHYKEKVKLEKNDRITFAKESFRFV